MHENIRPPLTLLINDATGKIKVWFCICFIMEQFAELGAKLNLCLSSLAQSNLFTLHFAPPTYKQYFCLNFHFYLYFTNSLYLSSIVQPSCVPSTLALPHTTFWPQFLMSVFLITIQSKSWSFSFLNYLNC